MNLCSQPRQEWVYELSKVWKDISDYHYNIDLLNTIKWDSIYCTYIDKVNNVKSDKEFYFLLQQFIALTNDGHTEFSLIDYLRKEPEVDGLPFATLWIKDKLYISMVAKNMINLMPLGSRLLTINDIEAKKYFEKFIFPYISANTLQDRKRKSTYLFGYGDKGDSIKLSLEYPSKEIKTIYVKYDGKSRGIKASDIVSIPSEEFDNTSFTEQRRIHDKNYYYMRFDNFSSRLNVHSYMSNICKDVQQVDYMVLDLRNNSGGDETKADSLLMYFVNTDTLKTYKSIVRTNNAYYAAMGFGYKQYKDFYLNRHREIFPEEIFIKKDSFHIDLPMFILISNKTYSAAEDLLIALKLHYPNRAVLVGSATGGSTGAPLVRLLANGQYYRICTRWPLTSNGLFENGIQPDYSYIPTIDELLKNKDLIFELVYKLYKNETK